MKTEFVRNGLQIHILYNDEDARKFATDALLKSAIVLGKNAIFIVYKLQSDIILLHVTAFEGYKNISTAMQDLKHDLLFGELHTEDEKIQEILNEPTFNTRVVLLDFLEKEMKSN